MHSYFNDHQSRLIIRLSIQRPFSSIDIVIPASFRHLNFRRFRWRTFVCPWWLTFKCPLTGKGANGEESLLFIKNLTASTTLIHQLDDDSGVFRLKLDCDLTNDYSMGLYGSLHHRDEDSEFGFKNNRQHV